MLHDLFDLPFDEIAPIVGRSPVAARQLAGIRIIADAARIAGLGVAFPGG